MSTIRFQILPPVDRSGDPVHITGNVPALGLWQPEQGLRLEWRPPFHTGEIEAETGAHLEYKIVRSSWETEAVDAYGHVPENSRHEVWLDATLRHTVADWKDRFSGRLTRESVTSQALAGSRDLLVWLPHNYVTEPDRRFPVIVLHDGANVFDPQTSPLSHVDWAADEWVNRLTREGVLSGAVVVGVCHPEGFSDENETLRDFDLSPELGGAAYAEFVARELPAHLDSRYRTLAKPGARILGGADLGAWNTVFTAVHHPGIYGRFVGLSAPLGDPEAPDGVLHTLQESPSLPDGTRLYFDHGTDGMDAGSAARHDELRTLLQEKGGRDGRDFQVVQVTAGSHNELSWRQRFGDALRFLVR